MEEDQLVQIKKPEFNFNRFVVAEKEKGEQEEFEHWVDQTAKLIKRSYIQTFRLMNNWSLEKIKTRYLLATKHSGNIPPDVYWWWQRKQDKL